MRLGKKILTQAGLQFRMTAYVTSVVLLVSAVALWLLAGRIRKNYEVTLNRRISDDLAAIMQNTEQRMLRIEDATNAMANIVPLLPVSGSCMDSVLCRTLETIDGVQAVFVVLDSGRTSGAAGQYGRYAYVDGSNGVRFGSCVNGDSPEDELRWQTCFVEGRPFWSEPAVDPASGQDVIGYAVPLCNGEGVRAGLVCSWVPLGYVTSFITEYKVRKDIDISVYSGKGNLLVAPDDYILELSPDDLITRELRNGHLDWRFILSADRGIIDGEVRHALVSLALLILLTFVVMTIAIRYSVRFVAKPFVLKQRQIEEEKAVMANEMQLASCAQNELVPHLFPPFPERKEIDLSACLYPAREVGGDLYDYFLLGDRLYFCIGDVSGKGVQAALFMASVHYLFRSMAAGMPLNEAAGQMNHSLSTDNEECRFVTFWLGCLDLASGALDYVNAGHAAPVLVHDGKVGMFPISGNMPLGVLDDEDFVPISTTLSPGDTLLLYTDGVTEARDPDGHEFGTERMLGVVGSVSDADASGIIGGLLDSVRQHAAATKQSDDITMLCLKYKTNEQR